MQLNDLGAACRLVVAIDILIEDHKRSAGTQQPFSVCNGEVCRIWASAADCSSFASP